MNNARDLFCDVIFAYTRDQAIEDGELIDVSSTAKEAGFTFPVAVTRAVWNEYIDWTTADDDRETVQHTSDQLRRTSYKPTKNQ